jgi:hypothetical protein
MYDGMAFILISLFILAGIGTISLVGIVTFAAYWFFSNVKFVWRGDTSKLP